MRNYVDAHLVQIVCDKNGITDWCIVLVEMPLTLFWRVMASSDRISFWIPLKTQHSIPCWLSLQRESNSGVLTSLLPQHLSSSLTDSLPSSNLFCHSKTDAQFMQDCRKAVRRLPYVSVAFLPSLLQNFIAYLSSKVSSRPDCIFEIHQLWQSDFSRVYSNSCCNYSFESDIKIG